MPISLCCEQLTLGRARRLKLPRSLAPWSLRDAARLLARLNPTQPEPAALNSAPRAVAAFDDLSIADEARLLEEARHALADNPARALELANRHQELLPSGQLGAERDFIVVDALLRLGRRDEAERRAAPRLAKSPDSLYARRLRQLLGPMGR